MSVQDVTLALAPCDARELWQALMERPHNEEWSDRVAGELSRAMAEAEREHSARASWLAPVDPFTEALALDDVRAEIREAALEEAAVIVAPNEWGAV